MAGPKRSPEKRYIKYKKGKLFGTVHFSPELREHKAKLQTKVGLLGYLKFRSWIKEQEEAINQVLQYFPGREYHLFYALSVLDIKDKGTFLYRLEHLLKSPPHRQIAYSFVEAIGKHNFDGATAERILEMLSNVKGNKALLDGYAQIFNTLMKAETSRIGPEILSYFSFVEGLFAEKAGFIRVRNISGALEASRILFDLALKSNPELVFKKGSNFFWIMLRIARENRFKELFNILNKIEDLPTYCIICSKIKEQTIRTNFDKIIQIMQQPDERDRFDKLAALIK